MRIFEQLQRRRGWSEDERIVLDQVRRVAREVIAPAAAELDRSAAFPWDNVKALNQLGLNAIFVPEGYGGAPMSYRLYLECVAIISGACASTGIIYATNFHGMKPLIDFGGEEQPMMICKNWPNRLFSARMCEVSHTRLPSAGRISACTR